MPNKTLTIGIPAYNEEANIAYIINDIFSQKLQNVDFTKLIIASDGSTDNTNNIVKNINNQKIQLLISNKTEGISARENEIIRNTNSDILVILNADISLENEQTIAKLVSPIIDEAADLTSCPINNVEPTTLLEKILAHGYVVKNTVYENFRGGNNVYTCHGPARAFSKQLYKKIEFKDGPGEDAYSYFFCKSVGLVYKYVSTTSINFRLPDNFRDYKKQNLRFIESKQLMQRLFGYKLTKAEYILPLKTIAKTVIIQGMRNPLFALAYCILYLSGVFYSFIDIVPVEWDSAISSKRIRK